MIYSKIRVIMVEHWTVDGFKSTNNKDLFMWMDKNETCFSKKIKDCSSNRKEYRK